MAVDLHTFVSSLTAQELFENAEHILYALYNLPKWNNNVKFIDMLVLKMSDELKDLYLIEVYKMWNSIDVNFKDKFLYLLSKLERRSIVEIVNSNIPLEVKCYFLRNRNLERNELEDLFEYAFEGNIAILKTLVTIIKESMPFDKQTLSVYAKRMRSNSKRSLIANLLK